MAPPSQKADQRPISFVLHDTSKGSAPIEVGLVIRPEDLTRTDTSRLNTVQTLGGAWVDSFGSGLPAVQIAGHTGWGSGDRPSGVDEFQKLYDTVFRKWHDLRAAALKAGLDPDKVKLLFVDGLDDFTWVVAPQNFILKRNRSRPLLAQYQINLGYVSSDVSETLAALAAEKAAANGPSSVLRTKGLASLAADLAKITGAINAKITSFLGPLKRQTDRLLSLTASALTSVNSIISSATSVSRTLTGELIGVATSLSRAAANAIGMVHSIVSLPLRVKAQFMRLGSALENTFCILSNLFKPRRFLPNYSDLYGASVCSSTAGGSPISRYDTENPFPVLYPVSTPAVSVSSKASAGLTRLLATDPVLKPMSANTLTSVLSDVADGITLAA